MNLSNIKPTDILFKANKEDIDKIVFIQDNNYDDTKSDIGLVFGGISMIPYRIEEAIRLYQNELINKILVSGGIGFLNIDRKTPEAIKMYDYLIKNGIPKSDIIIEDKSRNTIENINNSLKLLSYMYNIDNTTFKLITSDFHLKRCIGLFENIVSNSNNITGSGVLDGKTDINSWNNSLSGRNLIIKEAITLSKYARDKRIADTKIKGLTLTKKR